MGEGGENVQELGRYNQMMSHKSQLMYWLPCDMWIYRKELEFGSRNHYLIGVQVGRGYGELVGCAESRAGRERVSLNDKSHVPVDV